MVSLRLVLLIGGLICFILDAIGVNAGKIRLTPLGLALWVLTILVA